MVRVIAPFSPYVSSCRNWLSAKSNVVTSVCVVSYFNSLTGTLKPQSNIIQQYGDSYTLAVDGWVVTFDTARMGLGSPLLVVPNVTAHPSTVGVPTSRYSMWLSNNLCPLKG